MLHVENMWVTRGAGYRIELPHLDLARGAVQAIIGASGCGKSTVLEMIGLILCPHGLGHFRLGVDADGQALDIAALLASGQQPALAAIRARQLGFVLQTGGLLPFLSARQNIALPRRLLGLPAHSAVVDEVLTRLELTHLLDRLPGQLSIGERQRVAFVRAIAHQPQLLLADEPTAALDPPQAKRLFALIIEIARQLNISVLVVSHDWPLVEASAIPALHGQPLRTGGTVFVSAS